MSDQLNAYKTAAMATHAQRIVEEWKEAHGKPLLSPVASGDLAHRIFEAMTWAADLHAMEWWGKGHAASGAQPAPCDRCDRSTGFVCEDHR
ncbi:hypothetical protein [Bradyrhizobium sp.]|uniref:hypothetical protein n=1 Tax=Bradyrhizobium sp. TaxID=376 RepID=UPI00271C5499|nr:hypothetical protein [Bradyrhizobium sp.]MDO9296847.1 hypothetical protein [Bradyrhizobium sp.]